MEPAWVEETSELLQSWVGEGWGWLGKEGEEVLITQPHPEEDSHRCPQWGKHHHHQQGLEEEVERGH